MATDPRIRYDIEARASGAAEVEKLAREFEQLDGAFPDKLSDKVKKTSETLNELGRQQAAIESFTRISAQAEAARKNLDEAQAAAQKFNEKISASGPPTAAQSAQLGKLNDQTKVAAEALARQSEALDKAGAGLRQFGLSEGQLAQVSAELATQTNQTATALQRLLDKGASAAGFQKLVQETDAARLRMEQTARAAETLASELQAVQRPTDGEAAKLRELRAAADTARADFQRLQTATVEQSLALKQAGVNTELLMSRTREAAAAQQQSANAAQRVSAAYKDQGAAAARSGDQQAAAAAKAKAGLDGIAGQLRSIQALGASVLGGQLLSGTLGDVSKTADAYANLQARIKLVTGEGAALTQAFNGVFDVALRTNTALEGTGTLFARIAQANRDLGLSTTEATAQALALTETINQAIQVSGGSAQAADAAITQLIQGLQSGVLRGEEFNSVMEQAPRLARALADGLGVTTGQLRKLAEQGQLTSQTVISALKGQSETLKKEFEQLPATVSRALTNLSTEWTKFIGQLDRSSGATTVVAEGINKIADNLDTIARLAGFAGAALTASLAVQGVSALRAMAVEAAAASKSATILTASLNNIPKVISITVAAAGLEIGFEIGQMLYQNSSLARQLGVGLVAFFENIVNDLKFVKDAAAAVFTSDTVEASFDRFRERGRQLDETFSQMWKDAEQLPITYSASADIASQAAGGLANAGAAASNKLTGAAGSAAGAVGGIGKQATTAEGAILAIGTAAGLSLPAVGATANQQATEMVKLLLKSQQTADVFSRTLPEAISKLSGSELAEFRAALVAALGGAQSEAQRLAQGLEAVGKDGAPKLAEAERAARLLKEVIGQTGTEAAQALGVDLVAASNQVSTAFREQAERLSVVIRSLPELKAAGIDTGTVVTQALGNMIAGARNQAEIDLVIARLQALGQQGILTGDQVSAGLKLGADKAKELKEKAEDATPGINGLGEAARKAGVDVGLLTTGVSEGFANGVKEVENLAIEIEKAGIGAERASPILADALDKRLQAAQTKEEVELLRKEAEKLGASGKLAGDDFTTALEKIKAKAQEVSPEIRQMQKDAKLLGVQFKATSQDAEAGVEATLRAYERQKAGGKATAAELQQAFVNLAKKAIEASGGQIPEWVKVEAAMRGVRIETDAAGRATIQYGDDATGAFKRAKDGADSVVASLSSITDAATKARKAADLSVLGKNVDKNGFATDANGNTISITGQLNIPDGGSFDNAAFQRAQQTAAQSGLAAPNPQNFVVGPDPAILVDPSSVYGQYAGQFNGGAGASPFGPKKTGSSVPAPAPAPKAPSSTTAAPTMVTININGKPAQQVNVASASDASALEAVLRQVADAARSSGFSSPSSGSY